MRGIEYDREVALPPPVFDGPVDRLTRMCKEFLASPTIDDAQVLHDEFKRYLSLPDSLGQVGLFLLRGGLTELFAQASALSSLCFCPPACFDFAVFWQGVKLRDMVLDVLASPTCNLPTPSLSTRDVRAQPGYQTLDTEVRARLDALTMFHDEMHNLVTFAMYDPICVLVFLAVYILREKRQGKNDAFLSSESSALVEAPWVYAHYISLLQDMLFTVQDRTQHVIEDLSKFVFSRDMDESSIRGFFMRDFPRHFHDIKDVITRARTRSKYSMNRMTAAVTTPPPRKIHSCAHNPPRTPDPPRQAGAPRARLGHGLRHLAPDPGQQGRVLPHAHDRRELLPAPRDHLLGQSRAALGLHLRHPPPGPEPLRPPARPRLARPSRTPAAGT